MYGTIKSENYGEDPQNSLPFKVNNSNISLCRYMSEQFFPQLDVKTGIISAVVKHNIG